MNKTIKDIKLERTAEALHYAEILNNEYRKTEQLEPVPFRIIDDKTEAFYLYSVVLCSNKDEHLPFEEFIKLLDDAQFASKLYTWCVNELTLEGLEVVQRIQSLEKRFRPGGQKDSISYLGDC